MGCGQGRCGWGLGLFDLGSVGQVGTIEMMKALEQCQVGTVGPVLMVGTGRPGAGSVRECVSLGYDPWLGQVGGSQD